MVKDELQRRLKVPPSDVDIAPLGIPGQPSANDTLLAGRFSDDQAPVVAELVREAGGEIVANVDETWTRPRRGACAAPAGLEPALQEERPARLTVLGRG